MIRFYKIFCLALILFGAISQNLLLAQRNNSGTISGIVIDSVSQKPLEFVTVSLKTKSLPAKVGLTKNDGSFQLTGLPPGKYILSFSMVNYSVETLDTEFLDSTKRNMHMGTVYMNPGITTMKAVVVNGTRPLVKQEIDRIVYDLEADPDSKGNNLLTMMRKVPFLSVDGDDNMLLKGKNDFRVFINGKPSSMFERNLKEVLRSMPASTIQRIEVITNPSSKYDAEGLAGIIDIITSRKIEGYRGSINSSERFPVGGPGVGSSFSVKKRRFGMSVLGGVSKNKSPQTQSSNYRISSDTNKTSLQQNSLRETNGFNGYFGMEMSFELDSLNLISAQANINRNKTETDATQRSAFNDKAGLLQTYDLENNSEAKGRGWDAAINYQLGFKGNKNKLLTFSYRYLANESQIESQQDISNRLNYSLPNFIQNNNGAATEHTMQVDYVQAIKKVMIEAGMKGIMRSNKSDYIYSSLSNGGYYEVDHSQSNRFTNDQNIFGAYNTYQFQIKKFGIKTGFRLEQTAIDAAFISSASNVSNTYFNLVPNLAVNRKIDASKSLNFGFSQRIKRPGITRLNPFVDRTNPNFESSGNPDLVPAIINTMQVGYSRIKKTTVNIGLDYSFVRNLFMQITSYNPATLITRTSFENVGRVSGLSANLYISCPATKALNISLNANGGFNKLEGRNGKSPVEVNIFTYNVSAFGNYKFNKGWRASTSVNVISRNITSLQGKSNGLVTSSLGVNKDLIKNKLSFSASVNNPVKKLRNNRMETNGPNFLQSNISRDWFRTFNISMNYNFGKLKDAIKKNKRGIKNDDL